jgi:tetratricopeptide (TPR) repeat protein
MKYGAYDKSREYLMKALEYDRREGDVVGGMKNLTNIGVSYQEEKKYEKAKEFHLKAYAIAQKKNLRMFMGTILLNIGDCYFNLDDFSKAQSYLSKGVRIAEEENEKMASIRGNIQFARLYQKSKPDSALYFANKGLVLAHQVDDKLMEEKLLRVLYEVHENQGGYREALNSYKRWKTTLDTIYSEKNTRAVFESEARYAAEKQKILDQMTFDKDIAEQKLKSQTKLYLLLGAFASLVAIFVVVLWIRQNSSEKEKTVLLHQIELIKERAATQFISVEGRRKGMKLDKGKLETHLGTALGESSWNILTAIYEKPTISNREIAQQVFLSLEGVSSSLRRMYRSFEVTSGSSKNLKVALVTKAIKISLGELGKDVPLRIGNHKVNRLEELLPGRWKKSETGKI